MIHFSLSYVQFTQYRYTYGHILSFAWRVNNSKPTSTSITAPTKKSVNVFFSSSLSCERFTDHRLERKSKVN